MTISIHISNNAKALNSINPEYSVEAEFGEEVVKGNILTLAHHSKKYSKNLPPCIGGNIYSDGIAFGKVAISHFDLDTLGGVMRIMGVRPEAKEFWVAAGFVDINGVHKIGLLNLHSKIIDQLNAFWCWSNVNKLYAPTDGSVKDCTLFFEEAVRVLNLILRGDKILLEKGRKWFEIRKELEKESFIKEKNGVILRASEKFTNHLYGESSKAVVAFNQKFKSITVSLADPIDGISCCDFVQQLWGEKAGGHKGIAGSPREQEFTEQDAHEAFDKFCEIIK